MSESDNRRQSTEGLTDELIKFYCSESLSESGLREIIERHELTSNNNPDVDDYDFFHYACSIERISEAIIRLLLEYFPDAANDTSELDWWTPLHTACENPNVTRGIIQLLIDAAPNSVRNVTKNNGEMPLHHLCGNKSIDQAALVEITELLIERCPEAVRHVDDDGDLPIHIAAMMAKSPELCQVLIEAYPGSERIANAREWLPLHNACYDKNIATVEYLYKLYPDAIFHATTGGDYPIHLAINRTTRKMNPKGVEVVRFLLDSNPNVKLQKHRGKSLLRYACQQNYNDSNIDDGIEIVKIIYDAHPEAIEDNSIASNIQHYHQQVQSFVRNELVYARQAKDHRLMMTPDDSGQLPLHTALQNNVRIGSIKLLVKGNPSAIRNVDTNFAMPLHLACEHHNSASVVQYLLDLDRRTLRAVDIDNNSALHYACHGAKYDAIALLLEKYDAASVSKRNATGKIPIDLLWESTAVAVGDRESVGYTESVYRLLKAYPETVLNYNDEMNSHSTQDDCSAQNVKKRKLGAV